MRKNGEEAMFGDKTLNYYFNKLDLSKLSFVRAGKGYSKKFLADILGVSPSLIGQYESKKSGMSYDIFVKLVDSLNIHPQLLTSDFDVPAESLCHFRAVKKVSQVERLKVKIFAFQVHKLYAYMEKNAGLIFPEQSFIPQEAPKNITEQIVNQNATTARQNMGLGLGPISNMANLVESLGIRIVLLKRNDNDLRVDGFATWFDGIPYIAVDGTSPNSRLQFDYAHELAHILFDEETSPDESLIEKRANMFAGAFLMPSQTFFEDCPPKFNFNQFIEIKKFWSVSIQAALYRGKQVGKISEQNYRNAIIRYSAYRKEEHGEESLARPLPLLLNQAIEIVLEENTFDLQHMLDDLALLPHELKELLETQGVSSENIKKCFSQQKKAKQVYFSPKVRVKK